MQELNVDQMSVVNDRQINSLMINYISQPSSCSNSIQFSSEYNDFIQSGSNLNYANVPNSISQSDVTPRTIVYKANSQSEKFNSNVSKNNHKK